MSAVKRPVKPSAKSKDAREGPVTPEVVARRRRVVELRKRGYSPDQIAKAETIELDVAQSDLRLGLASFLPQEERADVLRLELSRLDRYQRALDGDAAKGNARSILTAIKIMDRRAKYLGIDAPERHEHSGPNGGPVEVKDVGKMSEAELRAYLIANGIDPGPAPPTAATG